MNRKTIRWTALGATIAATAVTVPVVQASGRDGHSHVVSKAADAHVLLAQADGAGEGGEGGEGGESGAVSEDDDLAYHVNLGLIEGHLTVGTQLYAAGLKENAATHMKHPQDEIYADLLPVMKERGAEGFAPELEALAAAVNGGASAEEAQARLDAVIAKIDETGVPETARERVDVILKLLRISAEEYGIGVKDGAVVEAHEYQDAYGFVQAAKRLLRTAPEHEREEYGALFDEMAGYLNNLDAAWPNLAGEGPIAGKASEIAGAAARIEIAGLGID